MLIRLLMTAAIICSFPSLAAAASVTTPALFKASGEQFNCRLLNNGKKAITNAGLAIHNSSGIAVATQSVLALAPGTTLSVSLTTSVEIAYCRLQGKFPKKAVKVTLCRHETGGPCLAAVTVP